MVSRNGKKRAPRRLRGAELNPYLPSAAESAPLRDIGHPGTGAGMVFLAGVLGPATVVAAALVMSIARFGTLEARLMKACLRPFDWLSALLTIMVTVGAYRLTDNRRFESISDELRAVARLSVVVHSTMLALAVVAYEGRYWIEYGFFEPASGFTHNVAEALLALVAAHHLALAGSGRWARAARLLAIAMLVAIVAGYLLMRGTRDEMLNPVPPQYAYMVPPMNIALWLGKLAVFGTLWRTLVGRARPTPSPAMGN